MSTRAAEWPPTPHAARRAACGSLSSSCGRAAHPHIRFSLPPRSVWPEAWTFRIVPLEVGQPSWIALLWSLLFYCGPALLVYCALGWQLPVSQQLLVGALDVAFSSRRTQYVCAAPPPGLAVSDIARGMAPPHLRGSLLLLGQGPRLRAIASWLDWPFQLFAPFAFEDRETDQTGAPRAPETCVWQAGRVQGAM